MFVFVLIKLIRVYDTHPHNDLSLIILLVDAIYIFCSIVEEKIFLNKQITFLFFAIISLLTIGDLQIKSAVIFFSFFFYKKILQNVKFLFKTCRKNPKTVLGIFLRKPESFQLAKHILKLTNIYYPEKMKMKLKYKNWMLKNPLSSVQQWSIWQ